MTLENNKCESEGNSLSACDCVFFTALTTAEQGKNRDFREAAKIGKEIIGIHNSLCGPCISKKRIVYILNPNNSS